MRRLIFAAVSVSTLSFASLAIAADEQAQMQPAGYDPNSQMVCIYLTHEGILIRRPICQSAQAWLSKREHDRQEFRDQLRLSLLRNH